LIKALLLALQVVVELLGSEPFINQSPQIGLFSLLLGTDKILELIVSIPE